MAPDAATGNTSYFGIALTRFYDVAQRTGYLDLSTRQNYLNVAKDKASWIVTNCTDSNPNGFTGGYEGWDQNPICWKSTEHNIDAWVFAQNLLQLTGDPTWGLMADRAQRFVQSMYHDVNPQWGYYYTGTLSDGITPNTSPIPTDAQAWTTLARSEGLEIDTNEKAGKAMQWIQDNLKDGSHIPPSPLQGIKFSDTGTHIQSEVTASAAFAEIWLKKDVAQAESLLQLLDWIRVNAPPDFDGIANGIGIVATPGLEGASTGYVSEDGLYTFYYKLLHVASSSWTGLTCLYQREGHPWANPLMPIPELSTVHWFTVDASGD